MQGLGRTLLMSGMFALVLLGIGLRQREVTTVAPVIANHLPKNAMAAGIYEIDPTTMFDEWIGRFDRMAGGGQTASDELQRLDERLRLSFRDDVLGAFGPSFGFAIDLGPWDAASMDPSEFPQRIAEGVIVAVTVPDEQRAVTALTVLVEQIDGRVSLEDGRLTIATRDDELVLHGTLSGRTLVVAGSPERLDAATRGFGSGERLFDGADFSHCLSQVDSGAEMLTYVNLPRIRDWLRDGGLESLGGPEQMAMFLEDDWSGVGMMQTGTRAAGGLRTAKFSPPALGGGLWSAWTGMWTMSSGVQMLGSWMTASRPPESREPARRTMATMRAMAAAAESYKIDHGSYPATNGWSPADRWSGALQSYFDLKTTTDGWGRPLLVWSDGASYRIVSSGLDGIVNDDWTGELGFTQTQEPTADIVFADGAFAVVPQF